MIEQFIKRRAEFGACLAASLAVGAQISAAHAQGAVALVESVVPFGREVITLGAAEATATVSFQVALRLRDQAGLDATLQQRRTLTSAELAGRHLPTAGAYKAVRDWLTSQGLSVDRDTDDRLMIGVQGPVLQVSRALNVTFTRVAVGGQTFVAAQQAPTVPAALAPYIESINGLQPYQDMERLGYASRAPSAAYSGSVSAISPAITITGNYYPAGILRAYKALPYLTQSGHGTRTAILTDTFPNKTDLTSFYRLIGSSQTLANIEFVKVASGALPAPSGEETLDTEWTSGIGFHSKVRVYASGSLAFTALDAGFHAILSDLSKGIAINQLSISLGACEPGIAQGQINTDNSLLKSITAQGVSIFVSSGDSGAQECGAGDGLHPAFYSTSPYVTAVGGTHLIVTATSSTSTTVTIKSESGWSGSGGGISGVFAKPSYQSALSVGKRAVPDVAAVADPATGVDIVLNGFVEEIGGTSASAPIWAGLISLVNQARFAAGLKAVGQLNPRIYPLLGTTSFRDVTAGKNGGYSAAAGYDLVTGMGSPIMKDLLPTLVSQP